MMTAVTASSPGEAGLRPLLQLLGEPDAVACEGDSCELPGPHAAVLKHPVDARTL